MRSLAVLSLVLVAACADQLTDVNQVDSQRRSATTEPLLMYHGGPVLTTATVYNVFWGSAWASPAFVGDKITGLDAFVAGLNGSPYAAVADEYGGWNGQITSAITYAGHRIDLSPVPKLKGTPSVDAVAIAGEVCRQATTATANDVYNVYVDTKIKGAYCGYHVNTRCAPDQPIVTFSFHWNLDDANATACGPPAVTADGHSAGLARLANSTAHELAEIRTDPDPGLGWIDENNEEMADKCDLVFGTVMLAGTSWSLQALWSNAIAGCTFAP